MRSTGLLQLAACLSSFTPLASAWPGWMPQADALVARQATDETTAAETGAATGTITSAAATGTGRVITTRNLNTAKELTGTNTEPESESETGTGGAGTGKGTGAGTGKGSATKTSDNSDNEETGRETFAPNDPPGGVSMIAPATTAQATPLFKIGDHVSLSWNYTSLQGTPTAIDVLVSCSTTGFRETWTLTSNMTFATDVSYVWDTEEQANDVEAPLMVALYTLVIKDSDADLTALPDPGYLGAFNQFTFGLYTPKPYVPLSEWTCAGCNAAISTTERQAIGFALTMSLVTIASFTWFVTGLGLQ